MLSVCIWCAVQAGGEPGRSVNWGGAGVAGRARATAPPSKASGGSHPLAVGRPAHLFIVAV